MHLSASSDLLLCRQHIRQCRSQGEWYPVCHRGNRCRERLHDHSCCKYPVKSRVEKLWTGKPWGEKLKSVFCCSIIFISRRHLIWTAGLLLQVFIVEASGRRLLLLCGFGICFCSCAVLTIALNFQVRCDSFTVIHTLIMSLCCPLVDLYAKIISVFMSQFLILGVRKFLMETELKVVKRRCIIIYFQ